MENLSPWQKFKNNIGDTRPWHIIYKEHYVDDSLLQSRLKICGECPNFIKMTSQCKKCGCIMKLKGLLKEAVCPIGKW
jgi:hypothetical protein